MNSDGDLVWIYEVIDLPNYQQLPKIYIDR